MSRILRLDKDNYDLWLSYSWSENNHGICGHTFEVLDYYFHLKKTMRVGIFLCEDIDWETLEVAITEKYLITQEELDQLKNDTVFSKRPILVEANNILFTDGGCSSLEDKTLLCDKIIHFACGDKELQKNTSEKVFILQDYRIYGECFNSIDYKKKINFDKYKDINKKSEKFMLYATKNCRDISNNLYEELLQKYDADFICLTNKENKPKDKISTRLQFVDLPVVNFFECFGTYIYTPVARHFDCSPRLIAECKYYGRDVIYHNIDYWDEDKGLYWRKWDIDNNFDSIFLKEDDPITEMLKEII